MLIILLFNHHIMAQKVTATERYCVILYCTIICCLLCYDIITTTTATAATLMSKLPAKQSKASGHDGGRGDHDDDNDVMTMTLAVIRTMVTIFRTTVTMMMIS